MVEKLLTVKNRAGIHARPAAIIAQTANKFECEVMLARDDTTVNAKSIMGVITMAAGCRHTVSATTELKLIEVQLGKEISVNDKQKYELE